MNGSRLQRLFDAARNQDAPVLPEDFDQRVLRAIRREPGREPDSLFGQLNRLFPRLALAACLIIALCLAAELSAALAGGPGLTDGIAQLSEQWLFAARGD